MTNTVPDLIDELNHWKSFGEFKLIEEYKDEYEDTNQIYLVYVSEITKSPYYIVQFDEMNGMACAGKDLWALDWESIHLISEYVTEHFSFDWFEREEDEDD